MKRLFFLLLIILYSINVGNTPLCSAQTIRVAYPQSRNFTEVNEQGEYQGYIYDYLQELARYTGWEYEYVLEADDSNRNLEQLVQKMAQGKVDVMGAVFKNKEMEKYFDYTAYSSGSVFSVLAGDADEQNLNGFQTKKLDGMRVGVLQTAKFHQDSLKKYMKIHNVTFEMLFYDTYDDMKAALNAKTIDAIAMNESHLQADQKVLVRFASQPFYFVVNKGNKNVLAQLDNALAASIEANPRLQTELHEKYFATLVPFDFSLTAKEEAYLKNLPPLKVVHPSDYAPLHFVKKGEAAGAIIDIFNHISKQTGIKFQYLTAESYEQARQMLEEQKADIMAFSGDDTKQEYLNEFYLTRPFYTQNMVAVKRKDFHGNLETGILAVVDILPLMREITHDSDLTKHYKDMKDAIHAVDEGKADFLYGDIWAINYYTNHEYYNNIEIVGSTYLRKLSIGVSKRYPIELLTVLDKSIRSLSERDVQAIINKNVVITSGNESLWVLVRNNPKLFMIIILLFFGVVTFFFLYRYHNKTKENNRYILEGQRYKMLSEMINEYMLVYEWQNDKLILTELFLKDFACPQHELSGFLFSQASYSTDTALGKLYLQLADLLLAPEANKGEYEMTLQDGTTKWYRYFGCTVYDKEKKPVYTVGKLLDISLEKQEQGRLITQAETDGLTGVLNRAAVDNKIAAYLDECSSTEAAVIAILDVDDFKYINDNFGHQKGDEYLKGLARLVRGSLRRADLVGRYGGDEFVILLKNISTEAAQAKLSALLAKIQDFSNAQQEFQNTSASIGAVSITGHLSYDQAIGQADKALYEVKKTGKNKVLVYHKE